MESSLKKPARVLSHVWKKVGSKSRNGDNFDSLVANNSLSELEEGFKRLNFAEDDSPPASTRENDQEDDGGREEGCFNPLEDTGEEAAVDDSSPHALALKQLELNKLQREYKSTMEKLRRANEVDIESLFKQLDDTNEPLTKEQQLGTQQQQSLPDKERIGQLEEQVIDLRADLQESQVQLKQLKKEVSSRDVSIEQSRRMLELKDFELTEVMKMLRSRQDIIQKVNFTVTLFQNIVRHQYDEIDQLISSVETKSRTLAQTEDIIQQYINSNDQLRNELLLTRESIEEKRELEHQLNHLTKTNQQQQKHLDNYRPKPSPKRKHYTSKSEHTSAVKRVRKESPPTAPLKVKNNHHHNIHFNNQDGRICSPKEHQND